MDVTILDGPVGTELDRRGVTTTLPLWSAGAVTLAPDVLTEIHRDYAAAGASVHTANTFRTQPGLLPETFREVSAQAVALARAGVPAGMPVFGSLSPIEDCYRPDLSPCASDPSRAHRGHRAMADALRNAGVDGILCETFPRADEALVAVEEALSTGLPVWLALTAGPEANLMSPRVMGEAAVAAVRAGAQAVLVNCVPLQATGSFLKALSTAGVPFGAYANAGRADDVVGWTTEGMSLGPRTYADTAAQWAREGATLIGACCGTGPAHIRALAERFSRDDT